MARSKKKPAVSATRTKKKRAATAAGGSGDRRVVKKAAKKKAAKKKVAKKKAVAKKTTKKKAIKKGAKKTPTRKKAVAKKPAKKPTKKKTTSAQKPNARRPVVKKTKPAAPYAALAETPAPAYDPYADNKPTTAQLRKVKTGLKAKDLRDFRGLLLERRAEIIGDVQGLEAARSGNAGEISHMPLHMADVGSDNYEQEFTLGLMESERRIVVEIDEALQRIEDKTYGVCLESAVPIGRPRLEAKPWAKYCIEVARQRERRGL